MSTQLASSSPSGIGSSLPVSWVITSEDRTKHELTFQSLNPISGFLSGEQAKKYFLKSNLPPMVLGQIWNLADIDRDGKMTMQEFTIAVHLIQSKLKGVELPTSLPNSLKMTSMPSTFLVGQKAKPTTDWSQSANPSVSNGFSKAGMMTMPHKSVTSGISWSGVKQSPPQTRALATSSSSVFGSSFGSTSSGSIPSASLSASFTAAPNASLLNGPGNQSQNSFGSGLGNVQRTNSLPGGFAPTAGPYGTITPSHRLKYNQMFKANDYKKTGFLSGDQARSMLIQSGLSQGILAQIWNLSDLDKDGQLNMEEFAVAMHFVEIAKLGQALPPAVPPELLPPSYQSRQATVNNFPPAQDGRERSDSGRERSGSERERSGSVSEGKSRSGSMTVFTFEDKRKDNFEKGRLELERRRMELQEKMKKERDERERKELLEEERRQRAKLEAEQKRQAELEKQRQQQLEMEREQEALRKKMIQQRLAAQIEAERQRQLEWEKRKKEELLNHKNMEQDIVNNLKSRLQKLAEELLKVNQAKNEVQETLDKERQTCMQCQTSLNLINQSREMRFAEISRVQCDIKESQQRIVVMKKESERLSQEINQIDTNKLGDTHGNVMASVQDSRGNLRRLQTLQNNMERVLAEKLKELDTMNTQVKDLNTSIAQLSGQNTRLQQISEAKQREYAAWKQRKDEDERRVKEMEAKRKREEEEARKQRERELEAMRQEQEKQRKEQEMRRRLNEAKQAEEARRQEDLKKQQLITKDKILVQQQQMLVSSSLLSRDLPSSSLPSSSLPSSSLPSSSIPSSRVQSSGAPVVQHISSEKTSTTKTSGGDVKQKVLAMQQLIKDQGSDVKVHVPPNLFKPVPIPKEYYKVLYEFMPRNPDELQLDEGDIVTIAQDGKTPPPGWIFGEANGKKGLFPVNYVEKITEEEAKANKQDGISVSSPDSSSTVKSLAAALTMQLASGGSLGGSAVASQNSSVTSAVPAAETPKPTTNQQSMEGFRVMALYPYRAKKDDHLTFNKNDVIIVKEQQDMWWSGELNGNVGWFPKSYVKLLGATIKVSDTNGTVAKETSSKVTAPILPPETKPSMPTTLFECIALYDYTGEAGDLSFKANDVIKVHTDDGEWWEGSCKGQEGLFPANYVKKKEIEAPKAAPRMKPEIATVTTAYNAVTPEQLSLSPGQLILVKRKHPDGWWEGELQARGKKRQSGLFPANHVKILDRKASGGPAQSGQTASPVTEDVYSVPPSTTRAKLEQVLAMFPYTAQNTDELTFYKGSVINVVSKEGEWWKGEMNGQTGMFPSNYVQPLSDVKVGTTQWTGSFDAKVLATMSATERQRQNVIYELINTEQTYMDDLSATLEIFYNPLAESGMLTEQELLTVFINWKELIWCNMRLLKAFLIRKKMSSTVAITSIGDILCEMLPRLTPYVRFCSCQLKACQLLQHKAETNPEFKQLEKKCIADPRAKGLPLSSYLLKPLQRICKYPLLIREILKYTPENHFDRIDLETALEKADDLCQQVNEGVRNQENTDRLEWLQAHVNLESIGERLFFNSTTNCLGPRKLLHSGTLWKVKSGKELKAFLFNDFLMLTRPQSSITGSLSKKIGFNEQDVMYSIYRKPIILNEVIVKRSQEVNTEEYVFHLSHIDQTYSFRAETKTERNRWMELIEKASETYIETERELRQKAHRARSIKTAGIGKLKVTLIEGVDLIASDPNGLSDPYCEVSMGSQEQRTKVVPQTLNPKWNHTLNFTVKSVEQDVLCITVFDRDLFSPNDFLGRTEVSLAKLLAKGKGPWHERLLLYEVETGEVVVKIELQLH